MIHVDYKTVVTDVINKGDYIKYMVFSDPECDVCKVFQNELSHFESDELKIFIIEDQTGNPFPVESFPCAYIHIPHTNKPLFRLGGVTKEAMKDDVTVQLKAFREKRDYQHVRQEYIQQKQAET